MQATSKVRGWKAAVLLIAALALTLAACGSSSKSGTPSNSSGGTNGLTVPTAQARGAEEHRQG